MICFVRLEEEVVASCDTRRGREGRKVEGSACRVACLHYYTILYYTIAFASNGLVRARFQFQRSEVNKFCGVVN